MLTVVSSTDRMTPSQYETARTQLRETYGDSKGEAGARFEQELAKLFERSGWTQDELAKKEGKSRRFIAYQLTFGRFLNFGTSGSNLENLPQNLTERRFRSYWERTDKGERKEALRFREVIKLMQEPMQRPQM